MAKGPAFEIRFCDDNISESKYLIFMDEMIQVQNDYLMYHENEVLEGKLRYSKLIGYTPPPEENGNTHPSSTRSTTSRANQEILIQNSRYSKPSPLPDHEELAEIEYYHSKKRNDGLLTASIQQEQQEASHTPILAHNAPGIQQPTEAKIIDHPKNTANNLQMPLRSNNTSQLHNKPHYQYQQQQHSQQDSNTYSMAPSTTSTMMVTDEKYTTGENDNEYLYSESERGRNQKSACCCIIS
ncbi:hypothetical protein BDC45DRAFT_533143 [Circinella umbellata]|nr:hypothetical protein BDC45DRAFT_533143 [Circinella umbellata]